MIRYKKVLKASTKRTFHKYNIHSSRIARGVVQARPCVAMKSGVRVAIFLARAHFLPNEYNKNPRGDISVTIGISPNWSDGRGLQRRPLLSPLWLGGEGRSAIPRGHQIQLATACLSGAGGSEQDWGSFQRRRAGSAGPRAPLSPPGSKKKVLARRDLGGAGTVQHVPSRRAARPPGAQAAAASPRSEAGEDAR